MCFEYDAFVKNNKLVVNVQRAFRLHFSVGRRGADPNGKTIMRWVDSFRTTGIANNKKPTSLKLTVTTPENTERVRAAVLQSPRRSMRKQAQALQIFRSSIRRIVSRELKFHPYKQNCRYYTSENL